MYDILWRGKISKNLHAQQREKQSHFSVNITGSKWADEAGFGGQTS
jgi:hypothetical protein